MIELDDCFNGGILNLRREVERKDRLLLFRRLPTFDSRGVNLLIFW